MTRTDSFGNLHVSLSADLSAQCTASASKESEGEMSYALCFFAGVMVALFVSKHFYGGTIRTLNHKIGDLRKDLSSAQHKIVQGVDYELEGKTGEEVV